MKRLIPFLFAAIFVALSGCSKEEGCTYPSACNYDSDANWMTDHVNMKLARVVPIPVH